jgi:hypothetical protein
VGLGLGALTRRPTNILKKTAILLSLAFALLRTTAVAQTIVLDDFTIGVQAREGAAIAGTTWVGQVTQNATTITIAGTAHDDNGWGVLNLVPTFDATAMNWITVTGQLDPGNAAGSFSVQFFDNASGSQAFSISSSSFTTGMTTVNIPLGPWTTANPALLNGWSIGGGDFVTTGPDFHMTFDQLGLSATAIPEPGMSAVLAGVGALAFARWRRRAARS